MKVLIYPAKQRAVTGCCQQKINQSHRLYLYQFCHLASSRIMAK